jgi:polysaccharide deacetylase 2 family uncharacterized protein YibQ
MRIGSVLIAILILALAATAGAATVRKGRVTIVMGDFSYSPNRRRVVFPLEQEGTR